MAEKQTKDRGKKPQTKPKPTPRASVRPRIALPMFSRPMAASATQRRKRAASRNGIQYSGTLTAKKLDKGEGELMLYGTIGADFFGDGITALDFNEALSDLGNSVSRIRLRVNSGGGDVFEATAIYNMLVKHPAYVIVEVEGVAASAATLIAMAGDEVHISENAHWMIHRASGIAWGNADAMREYLQLLDNADELLRLTYAKRTGMEDAEISELMAFDNWMTAQQALDNGFVDHVDDAKSVEPHVTPGASAIQPIGPEQITEERLAAITTNLLSMAESINAKQRIAASIKPPTGGSPPTPPNQEEEPKMNEKLRAKCVEAGMPKDLNDTDANKWLEDNFSKIFPQPEDKPNGQGDDGAGSGGRSKTTIDVTPIFNSENIMKILDERDKAKAQARKAWKSEVDQTLELAFGEHISADLRNQCYELQEEGMDAVRNLILEARKKQNDEHSNGGVSINFSPTQPRDRHIGAIRAGLMVRCLSDGRSPEKLEKQVPEKDRPDGWEDFRHMPLSKIAEHCLYADGWRPETVRKLSNAQICQAALGFARQAGIRADAAVHTTGSLAEITRDAMNKSLLAAYQEAPQTWRGPGRQAASVPDFKDIHRIKLSGAANVPVWNDNDDPNEVKLSNEKEKYAVEARAETISFSWRLALNDDLDAISRAPQIMGNAMARTINAVFWQQITSNPTMADGVALFSTATGARKQDNFITGSATPTNTTIGDMRKLMRLMKGLNTPEGNESDDILNLMPTYIVGPAALEEIILKQVFSGADPADNKSSATFNTARNLTPIIEPLLDANSETAWYLFASPNTIDTVEVTFLQGQEEPVTHEFMDDRKMSQNFTIIQTFESKAIDWRGIIKHKGAA